VPSNDGLGSDHCKGISNVREQSIEADKYYPVESIEAESLGRSTPQDNDLLPQDQVLGLK
jgi:hypothetical protein